MPPKILQIATKKKHRGKLKECALYSGAGQQFMIDCIIDREVVAIPLNFNAQTDDPTQVVNVLRECLAVVPAVGHKIVFDGIDHTVTEINDHNQIEIGLTVVPDA